VLEAGYGIARVRGLANVKAQEMVQFANGVPGIAFNLERNSVGVIVMGDYSGITEGMIVRGTRRIMSVPVGDALIGRVVNALCAPLDNKGSIAASEFRPIERIAPGVIERQDVDAPVQTGINAIDAMIPIGRGQRELIIGDRQTGKTAIALDTIINQRGGDVQCFYVAIGQKRSTVAQVVDKLTRYGAMEYTTVVMASASDPAPMQFIVHPL
jgi:F-type H+-transporting ATPase subunit alpha